MRIFLLYLFLAIGIWAGMPIVENPAAARSGKVVYRYLTPETALEYIHYHKQFKFVNFGVIDLRDKDAYAEGHLEHATHIDYADKDAHEALDKLDHGKAYLLYNQNGRSSSELLRLMEELHFREAYFLTGGVAAWQKKGLALVKE